MVRSRIIYATNLFGLKVRTPGLAVRDTNIHFEQVFEQFTRIHLVKLYPTRGILYLIIQGITFDTDRFQHQNILLQTYTTLYPVNWKYSNPLWWSPFKITMFTYNHRVPNEIRPPYRKETENLANNLVCNDIGWDYSSFVMGPHSCGLVFFGPCQLGNHSFIWELRELQYSSQFLQRKAYKLFEVWGHKKTHRNGTQKTFES